MSLLKRSNPDTDGRPISHISSKPAGRIEKLTAAWRRPPLVWSLKCSTSGRFQTPLPRNLTSIESLRTAVMMLAESRSRYKIIVVLDPVFKSLEFRLAGRAGLPRGERTQ